LFAASFLFLYWVAGDVLHMAGNEGIYSQGGRLVARGRQPYRDLFAITGPLSFWIEAVLAFSNGMSLAGMRLSLIFDAAFLVFAVYWLTSRSTKTFRGTSQDRSVDTVAGPWDRPVVMQQNEASR
jgi:hypothetical protein